MKPNHPRKSRILDISNSYFTLIVFLISLIRCNVSLITANCNQTCLLNHLCRAVTHNYVRPVTYMLIMESPSANNSITIVIQFRLYWWWFRESYYTGGAELTSHWWACMFRICFLEDFPKLPNIWQLEVCCSGERVEAELWFSTWKHKNTVHMTPKGANNVMVAHIIRRSNLRILRYRLVQKAAK